MNWLSRIQIRGALRTFVFLAAFVPIVFLVIVLVSFDVSTKTTLGILVLSTTLAAVGSLSTYMQAVEARRQRENAERPEVAVYFQFTNYLIYCVIQNFGKIPARDVKVEFTPSPLLQDGRLLKDLSLFAKPLPYLPPNVKYWRQLGVAAAVLQENSQPFRICASYSSSEGKRYRDEFDIDLTALADANFPEMSISYQLGEMSKSIDTFVKMIGSERLEKIAQDYKDDSNDS